MRVSFWQEPASPSAVATASSTRSATTMPATTPASASFCWGRSRRGHTRCARPAADGLSRRRRPEITISAEPAEPDQRRQLPSAGTAAYWRFARLQARHRRPRAGRLLLALVDGGGQVLALRCDADDGADNGVVLMEGIAPGSTPCARPVGPPPTTRPQPTSWSRLPKTRPLTSRS